jgi:TonB family protein
MKALICPVMLHDKSVFYTSSAISKMDRSLSFSISMLIHIVVFASVGALFIKPPQFGVNHGIGSIEVNLVAAPTEVVPQVPLETPAMVKSEFVEKQVVKPVAKVVERQTLSQTVGKDKVTVQSTGGAISEAKPDYLKNPAPEYPETARRRGYEGIVFLTADIDKNGSPVKVEIEKSSGHAILDEAALKAVKTWKFLPGKVGNLPIESTVRVPVRFYLDESR